MLNMLVFCDFRLILVLSKSDLTTFQAKIEKSAWTVFIFFIIPDCWMSKVFKIGLQKVGMIMLIFAMGQLCQVRPVWTLIFCGLKPPLVMTVISRLRGCREVVAAMALKPLCRSRVRGRSDASLVARVYSLHGLCCDSRGLCDWYASTNIIGRIRV